jgi:hydrogenase maturation factor
MIDGIAHFNGSDVQYIYKINSNVRLASSIIFDKQVIFSAIDFNTGNTLIIKGELKTK